MDAYPLEGFVYEISLSLRRPHPASGATAMPEAGAIEGYDPVFFASHGDQAAGAEILDHAAIAVQEDEGLAMPALDIMKPHTLDLEKPSGWRVIPFCLLRQMPIY
jgi:hypothetical protein